MDAQAGSRLMAAGAGAGAGAGPMMVGGKDLISVSGPGRSKSL